MPPCAVIELYYSVVIRTWPAKTEFTRTLEANCAEAFREEVASSNSPLLVREIDT